MVPRISDPKNPRILLETDHRDLDARLGRLVLLLREDDPEAAIKAWRSLEDALLAHFDVEEMYALPDLEESNALEARALRDEHDSMRRAIGALGLAFELHTIRAEMFDAFCERLRGHAEREESLLYKHAERHLAVSVARLIYRRLRGATEATKKPRATRAAREGARIP